MNILVIDNSSPRLSIAVHTDAGMWQTQVRPADTSVMFTAMVDYCLRSAGISLEDVEGYVLGTGPGSFTGLRMSLSVIKGFCAVMPRPVVAIPSYYALAHVYAPVNRRCVFIFDARRGLVYGAVYKKSQAKGRKQEPRVISLLKPGLFELEDFLQLHGGDDCLFAGESWRFAQAIERRYPQATIVGQTMFTSACDLIPEALYRFEKGRTIDAKDIKPLYLHPDTCQVRGKK